MGRLRASLARTEIDRKVATSMGDVERIVLSTLRECDGYVRSSDPVLSSRARAVARDLKKVLGAISGVRRVHPVYDIEDADLQATPAPPKKPESKTPTE